MSLSRNRRRPLQRGALLATVTGLHVVALLVLARPVALDFPDRSDDEDAIDVVLKRVQRPIRAAGGPTATAPAQHRPARLAPSAVEPQFQSSAPPQAAPVVAKPTPASPGFDLGAVLRGGGYACADARSTLLSPEERARCQEKLGVLAQKAPALPAPIDPGKRAYYDAVAEAYHDRRAFVPLTARGAKGMFELDDSVHQGHGPRVGCSVKFGPNADKAPKGPANALRAGPCFIQPPVGSLTPEGDIRKPY